MKKTLLFAMALVLAFATVGPVPVNAQTDVLVVDGTSVGLTPASPFYFLELFFEGIGTLFTFGDSAKAQRYLDLAEERLAEALALAEDGDARAQAAVDRYENRFARAEARAARLAGDLDGDGIPDVLATVTDAATRHLAVLDEVLERVPEEAKEAIQAARERSIAGQIETLRGIAQRDPEAAVDIFARAAEGRLRAAEARANRGDDDEEEAEEVEAALEEFNAYSEFGQEIASLAESLRTGETTVEELVERATSHHMDILRTVQSQVPAAAQEGIQRAMENAGQLQDLRPAIPAGPAAQQEGAPTGAPPAIPAGPGADAGAGVPPVRY